jgi:hypothetical protein
LENAAMRYKLPEGMTSITAGPLAFEADAEGYINVPDATQAAIAALLSDPYHHDPTPEPDAPAEAGASDKPPARKRR